MRQHCEYRVCQVQQSRVTYVNGTWQGKLPPGGDKVEAALASCMQTWDYLHGAGEDGWELVGPLRKVPPAPPSTRCSTSSATRADQGTDQRRERKNSRSTAPHSSSSTPPLHATTWFNRGRAMTS